MRLPSKLLFLALLGAATAHAQQADTVRLATLAPGALLWLHNIADVKGFYKTNHLEVKRLQVADSPALVQAVASGSAEAGISLGDLVMKAMDQNAPIVIAGGYITKTSLRLVGAKDVKNVKDLAGSKMTAGAVRGGTTNLMLYQLKLLGVDPNSIQRVSIPNSRDRVVALQAGQVRGAVMTPPFDIMAKRQGFPILDTYREPYLQTPLIFNKEWAAKNRAVAVRFVRASRAAAQWIYDPKNRAEAVDILAKDTGVERSIADDSYEFLVVEQKAYSQDLSVPEASMTNIAKIDHEVNAAPGGKAAPKVDASKYYDPSYLAEAAK
jgi:ABC-type nitrate/sulfonate/bicarbonate transport system substrate-binding protein